MQKWGAGGGFDLDILSEQPGCLVFRATGNHARKIFSHEPGGHRWQRVPPNEKRGRIQTSTVTVAVFDERQTDSFVISPEDLVWVCARGSGPGGQHRNKTESAVTLTHRPTGTTVHCENERSQQRNRETALSILQARLIAEQQRVAAYEKNRERRGQVGSGMRGDKIRTIRTQDNIVTDHLRNSKTTYARYAKGIWDDLEK